MQSNAVGVDLYYLQKMLDNSANFHFLIGKDPVSGYYFRFAEGKLARDMQMTTETIGGQNPVQVFGNDEFKQNLQRAFEGKATRFEFRYRGNYFDCALEPTIDLDGTTTDVTGVLVDVTQRKKTERKISLLARTLMSLNESINIADADDRLIYVNEAFCKLYGYNPTEVIGRSSSILWSSHNPSSLTESILPATLNGGWVGELYNRRKDGTNVLIRLATSVVRDENNEIIGFVGLAREAGKPPLDIVTKESLSVFGRFV